MKPSKSPPPLLPQLLFILQLKTAAVDEAIVMPLHAVVWAYLSLLRSFVFNFKSKKGPPTGTQD